jgi:O-antigen/teichoic acid export membrane protein
MILLKNKIKARLGPLWWYAAVMFCVGRFGDVINLYTGLWLVPKWVPPAELGALLPLGQIGGLLGLPLAILLTPFMKFLSAFGAKEEYGKVKALLHDALVLACVSAVAIAAYTWYSAPFVFERLRIGGTGLIWLLCGIAVTSAFMPVLNNGLQALKLFRCMGAVGMASAPFRLFFLLALLPACGLLGFFSAQFLANVATLGISFWGLRTVMSSEIRRESYRGHLREMLLYTLPIAALMAVGNITSTAQLLVIRQRLPDVESAAFYFGSRFSEIPNILWSAIAVAFFPIISEAFEKGKDTRRILTQVLLFTVGGGAVVAVALGVGIEWLFGEVPKWKAYQPYAYLVVWMAMTNVFRVASACFTTHEMACRRFGFISYGVPIALLEAAALVSLTGYGFFVPYLPPSWVEWMGSLRAARLEFIVWVMLASSFAMFLGLVIQMSLCRPGAKRASA